jgi:hypothetical protein
MSRSDVTRQELEAAKVDGERARRAGRARKNGGWNFGNHSVGDARTEALNAAWVEGWDREDARRGKG